MKFKIYNAENSPHTRVAPGVHEAHITVCRNGRILLNKYLLKLLKNPDRVAVIEDEEYKGDFYVAASNDRKAFTLDTPDKRNGRSFASSTLAEILEETVGAKRPFIISVSEEPTSTELGKAYALAVKKVRPFSHNRKTN